MQWYSKAAEQGDAGAQFSLGWMYASGQGVTQDYKAAVQWFSKAAQQGHASAQNKLGVMYAIGQGVAQDTIRAHMWANLAASNRCGYKIEGHNRQTNDPRRYRKSTESCP
ncbi:MAG: tetratricopeptide repeat protein [Arenicellales bacterium WSBS_2016_MAG_OTU3]